MKFGFDFTLVWFSSGSRKTQAAATFLVSVPPLVLHGGTRTMFSSVGLIVSLCSTVSWFLSSSKLQDKLRPGMVLKGDQGVPRLVLVNLTGFDFGK